MQSRRASWLSGKWDKKGLPILELYRQALSAASGRFSFSRLLQQLRHGHFFNHSGTRMYNQFGSKCPISGFPHFYPASLEPAI